MNFISIIKCFEGLSERDPLRIKVLTLKEL